MEDTYIHKNSDFELGISSEKCVVESIGNGWTHIDGRYWEEFSGSKHISFSDVLKAINRRGYNASVDKRWESKEDDDYVAGATFGPEWYRDRYFPVYIVDGEYCIYCFFTKNEHVFQEVSIWIDSFNDR